MDLGARNAGLDIIFANDVDRIAVASYEKLLPGILTTVSPVEQIKVFPKAHVLMGGYPCQSFSMGGRRAPASDGRSELYRHFVRALDCIRPEYFIVENVSGLRSLDAGAHFHRQLRELSRAGDGYIVTWGLLKAEDYGVPQKRRRVFIVGVRRDLKLKYEFPAATHGPDGGAAHVSHGDVIAGLPLWPLGEFYERSGGGDDNFPWYYMSRNRKARWQDPAFTVVANWRHVSLHPASPRMTLTWSNLSDGFKQRWDFSSSYDEPLGKSLPALEKPRRLSWRECALIQSFPTCFVPEGSLQSKYEQIGNAVPPLLAECVIRGLVDGSGLSRTNSRTLVINQGTI